MPGQNRKFLKSFHGSGSQQRSEFTRTRWPLLSSARKQIRARLSHKPPAAERHNTARMLFWMVLVALAIRLAVALATYHDRMNPILDYWWLGQEQGQVAKSIVQGHGFASPLYAPTGPTAWFAPIYPYILAGIFKVFGLFTTTSCLVILFFQSLVSALTCLPIFFFARRAFTYGAALAAGWAWAGFPYSVYWSVYRIWDTWLTTLLLAILFCVILKLARSAKMWHWIGFGVLSGITALTDPVVLGVLPVLALWAVWRLHQQGKSWFAPAAASVLAVIFTISPWMIRNAVVFHKFIPIRDNLALEFRVANNGDASEPLIISTGPWLVPWADRTEWDAYVTMGEIAYFRWKGQQAAAYIEGHPFWYAGMTARRVLYIWTGFWSFSSRYRHDTDADHQIDVITVPLLALLSVLTFLGLRRLYRSRDASEAAPYAIVLIFFPLIYYLTHVGGWYRCPMDPFIVTLAAYEVHSRAAGWLRRRRAHRAAFELEMLPPLREELPAGHIQQF